MKRNYGYADVTLASSEDTFPVNVVGQQDPEMITEEYLAQIIEARLQQIFGKLKADLERINALQLPGGIILTGGLAALPGVKELAQNIFGVNVNIYIPQEMNLRIPSFAQVIGLVEYVTQENEIDLIVRRTLEGKELVVEHTHDFDDNYEEYITQDDEFETDDEFVEVEEKPKKKKNKKNNDGKPRGMERFKAMINSLFD